MPVYRRTLLIPVTFTAADDQAADQYARDLLDAACGGAEALDTAGSLEVGTASVERPGAALAVALAVLLVHAAAAGAQLAQVRVEVSTVPDPSAGSATTYAHDLELLAAASETWGHAVSPGRALWWAQADAQPAEHADDPGDVTRGYQRGGLDAVLRDLEGGAA